MEDDREHQDSTPEVTATAGDSSAKCDTASSTTNTESMDVNNGTDAPATTKMDGVEQTKPSNDAALNSTAPSAVGCSSSSSCHDCQDSVMQSGDDSEDDSGGDGGGVSTRDLPDEILEHMLTFVLPYEDMQSCKLVSRRWYNAVKRVERQLVRLLSRSLEELNVAWFHYDTPNPAGSSPLAAAHRVITKRCAHSAAMLDGRMYVFGGCSSRMTSFNDLWWLELGELEWKRPQVVGAYPSPKAYASMVVYGDKLILFGGWSQAAPYPLYQSWKLFDELHIYDSKECRWEEVRGVSSSEREAGLPGAPRPPERWPPRMARHAASVHGHQMVVTGGLHHHSDSRFSPTNEVWVFDLHTEEWRHQRCTEPAPSPRYGHSQAALDERHMLLLGGSGGPNQLRQDAWLLELGDPSAEWRWHRLTVGGADNAPTQLWCHPACQVGDKVVVLGRGKDDTGALATAAVQPGRAPGPAPAGIGPPARAPAPPARAAAGPSAPGAAPGAAGGAGAAGFPAVRHGEHHALNPRGPAPGGRGVAIVPGRAAAEPPVRGLAAILDASPLRTGHNAGPGLRPAWCGLARQQAGPERGVLQPRRPPPERFQVPPEALAPARPSIRPNASFSRDRRLAGLLRAQQRLEAAAAERAAPRPRPRSRRPLTAGYRLVAPAGRRPLTLHVLDVRGAVTAREVTWRQCRRQDGPDERILYSLVAARGELVLFGGIVTPPRAAEAAADPEHDQNAAFNAVSFVAVPSDMFQ